LAAASDVFARQFFGVYDRSREVLIEDPYVCPNAFRVMLRYIYTDEVIVNQTNVMSVTYLAKKYMLTALEEIAKDWIRNNVNASNVLTFLLSVHLLDDIESTLWNVTDNNADSLFTTEAALLLDSTTISNIIKRDTLNVNELNLYEFVVKWATAECQRDDKDISPANLRSTLGEMLYLVRFPIMTSNTFAQHVAKSGILTDAEVNSLFQWFICGEKPPMFNTKTRRVLSPGCGTIILDIPNFTKFVSQDDERFLFSSPLYLQGLQWRVYASIIKDEDADEIEEFLTISLDVDAGSLAEKKCVTTATFRVLSQNPKSLLGDMRVKKTQDFKGRSSYVNVWIASTKKLLDEANGYIVNDVVKVAVDFCADIPISIPSNISRKRKACAVYRGDSTKNL
jgi:hypothetical protein